MLLRNKLFENQLEIIDSLNSKYLEYLPDYKMECSIKFLTVLKKQQKTMSHQIDKTFHCQGDVDNVRQNLVLSYIVYLMGISYWH